jgi:hypothetical protein
MFIETIQVSRPVSPNGEQYSSVSADRVASKLLLTPCELQAERASDIKITAAIERPFFIKR